MNSLLISMLMLGIVNMNHQLSTLADTIPNAHFEVVFDISQFEDGNLRGYPDITSAPHPNFSSNWFGVKNRISVRYYPPSAATDYRHHLRISCHRLKSPYHAFRWVGFTHEQILGARHIASYLDHDVYEIKTATRDCKAQLIRFEQSLGHGRGYDWVILRYKTRK